VRWIFVRDIPNLNLRHIKLKCDFCLMNFTRVFFFELHYYSNTQERKPVTNSRDTQELLPDAGQEMLRIFHTHPARTSLLQDFAFYEVGLLFIIFFYKIIHDRIPTATSYAKDASDWWRSFTFTSFSPLSPATGQHHFQRQ